MTPAISVIFPVYGVERYIEACMKSILSQSFQDFELILVDDGCLDGSIRAATALLEDSALSWQVLRQENAGQGPARDAGIRAASGKYVVCIDPDDTVSPRFLEMLYMEAEAGGRDVCFTGYEIVTAPKTEWGATAPIFQTVGRKELLSEFLRRTLIPILPAMLIRRDMILEEDLSVYPGCRFTEDIYLMWLLFSASRNTSYTKEPLYGYLCRPGSTMTASSAARMLTGYPAFQALSRDPRLGEFPGRQYLLSRWVLGVLHSSAEISAYPDFLQVAEKMNFRSVAKELVYFPEWKARFLALALRIHPRLFYRIIRMSGAII